MNLQLISLFLIAKILNFNTVQCIKNGERAFQRDFKYQALIIITNEEKEVELCGGAIIDNLHILTAAHCVAPCFEHQLSIRAGNTNLRRPKVISNVKKIQVSRNLNYHFRADQCGKKTRMFEIDHDVAVLTLESPIPLGGDIAAIPLPDRDYRGDMSCKIAGWGETETSDESPDLLWTEVQTLSKHDIENLELTDDENKIFTVNSDGTRTAARGDSGGGLVCHGKLVGIISYGKPSEEQWYPLISMNVYKYKSFIDKAKLQDEKAAQKELRRRLQHK